MRRSYARQLVHQMEERILHLGIIKLNVKEKNLCQCNSFMTTYKKDKNSDTYYRNLSHCYDINRIVRVDKITKRAESIYLSNDAECRERAGITKMLENAGLKAEDRLVQKIIKVNLKFGKYHLLQELMDSSAMLAKCTNKQEESLVKSLVWGLTEEFEKRKMEIVL